MTFGWRHLRRIVLRVTGEEVILNIGEQKKMIYVAGSKNLG